MCRLFGLTAGTARVSATFWLLDAPDSLEAQSRRNVDGSGIGFFDPFGAAVLDSAPSVVVASEELDGESGWRMLAPGELVHVRPDLTVRSEVVLPEPPARLVPLGSDNPNIDT